MFFHVLKNDCRVEALQLSTRTRLELGIYLAVAWLAGDVQAADGTHQPASLPARVVFSQEEWRAAYILNKKRVLARWGVG